MRVTALSSMATRAVLADLGRAFEKHFGIELAVESVGGVDAARRVAAGEAFDLELMHVPGVEVVGLLPAGAAFITTFSAALGKGTANAAAARAALEFINSPEGADIKRRHGMEPA